MLSPIKVLAPLVPPEVLTVPMLLKMRAMMAQFGVLTELVQIEKLTAPT